MENCVLTVCVCVCVCVLRIVWKILFEEELSLV
jgi:hypothetical protein